jgi:hypothetical protein
MGKEKINKESITVAKKEYHKQITECLFLIV